MEEAAQWINTLLLLFILWFQWNRNKTLSERISHQTKLVEDTKSVVTQQATALESQAKVVETAVRYSEAFDPAKMETVLRKQVEIESAEKIANIEKQHQKGLLDQDEKHKQQLQATLSAAVTVASNVALANIEPLMEVVIGLMIRVPTQERDALIAALPDSLMKKHLESASEKIESEYRKALAKAIIEFKPQQATQADGPTSGGSAA